LKTSTTPNSRRQPPWSCMALHEQAATSRPTARQTRVKMAPCDAKRTTADCCRVEKTAPTDRPLLELKSPLPPDPPTACRIRVETRTHGKGSRGQNWSNCGQRVGNARAIDKGGCKYKPRRRKEGQHDARTARGWGRWGLHYVYGTCQGPRRPRMQSASTSDQAWIIQGGQLLLSVPKTRRSFGETWRQLHERLRLRPRL